MNYSTMNTNGVKSQIEINKEIIQHYVEGYNVKNEAIFGEIIAPDYRDLVNRLIWTCLEQQLRERRMTMEKKEREV